MRKFPNFKWLMFSVALGLFIFSCTTDTGEGTSDFSSQQDAIDAVNDLSSQGFFDEIKSDIDDAVSQATSFSPTYLKAKREKGHLSKIRGVQDFVYGLNGFWTYAYDTTFQFTEGNYSGNQSENVLYKIRFTERDNNGYPTALTNLAEWLVDVSLSIDETDGVTTTGFDFSFGSDMDVNGIAGFNASTGNLTINGSGHQDFTISSSQAAASVEFSYHASRNINSMVISPTGDYPESGSISFTVRRSISPAILQQELPNFNVAGSITFDGSVIAVLVIGGYIFHLNLDTGAITPVT